MIAVWMVQPSAHEVIHVIGVRHRFVSAVRAMRMRAARLRCALHRVGGVDRDHVLVDVIAVHVVEMTIVQIVHMAVMANRRMTAVRFMLMGVVGMVFVAGGHGFSFLSL
jgi:hypothetical protein